MERRIAKEASKEEDSDKCLIQFPDFPGGDKTFELVAKFCYGVKLELTASNAVHLRCAAKHLEMTEEYGEGNLISQTGKFFNQVVFKSWKYSIKALQCCDEVLKYADEFKITKKCIESLAIRASADPNLSVEHGGPMQSPGGSVLWNGISTGARPKYTSSDWWYEDASTLSFPLFKRLVTLMDSRGIREEIIAGSLIYYTRKYLPVLKRRHGGSCSSTPLSSGSHVLLSEEEQKHLLEEIQELELHCMQKGLVPTKFYVDMLIIAKILKASPSCIENLEKRIGMQLDHATLEDLVMPSFSHTVEALYDVDSVQRIVDQFFSKKDQTMPVGASSTCSSVEDGCPQSMTAVAKLIDGYLAEVASDVSLKIAKFQALAASVPEYARLLDDGLYRAIDIYLKVGLNNTSSVPKNKFF